MTIEYLFILYDSNVPYHDSFSPLSQVNETGQCEISILVFLQSKLSTSDNHINPYLTDFIICEHLCMCQKFKLY